MDLGSRRGDVRVAGGGAVRRRVAPVLWSVLVVVGLTVPLWALWATPARVHTGVWRVTSLVAALGAASLLVLTFLLPSRFRPLTGYLGVERLLRSHRALALTAAGLVALHVVAVVLRPGPGLAVLDLRVAPPRVWAASAATLALLALVLLGLSRRRRRPRYEGWRLAHVLLANVALVATALHVLWLEDLTRFPEARAWFVGLALLMLGALAFRWVWRPLRTARQRYVVDEVRRASPTAVTLVLHATGHRGVPFRPGQFAWLKIGTSPFVFEEHPFTIASAATEPWRKEFTIKGIGDFSELVAGLKPGRRVFLDGPHGAFTLDGLRSDRFVLIAGGVGITPMLSMLRTLAARHDPRPVLLVVAGRTADELLHRADGEHLEEALDLRVVEVLEEPPADWDGHVGRLTEETLEGAFPRRRAREVVDVFICGPGPMVAAATRIVSDRGIPSSRIHTELFDVV
ncbi:ferredoxin reductase family protein [Phycicoccus sonneratiae]|uniref:Ferric reductase-like transmembrane domain-containing protein n=1 Tax=Phycicoccus sonneratiae TaxID=2807628 RepID=A0ABS2CIH3_9MICO|nr:ferric reductase-like transmembrane domain-containing protein [Phycicoccus sonneraticus]MBM6399678.1 ferric reductase-like transmembrane domain-containing protein [Phycicoccus sonneraticus]